MRNFTFKGLFLAVVFIVLGSLSIQAADGLITKQITIKLEKAGTLPDKIGSTKKYQITNLKILGEINGTDLMFIRNMAGGIDYYDETGEGKLSVLDLSQARIVVGGGPYFYYFKGNPTDGYSRKLYVDENDVLGDYMFCGCSALTSLTLPSSVTKIGNYAFEYCSGLTSMKIPFSVTSIGGSAFEGCSGLTSLVIPSGVTEIGVGAFSGCSGLTSLVIPSGVTEIGDYAFENCSGLTSMKIPSSVTHIGYCAFKGCSGLTSLVISSGVIGSSAFENCSGLTSLIMSSGVTSIGSSAFKNCSGLTSLVIPSGVTKIGYYAFENCSGLTSIYVYAEQIYTIGLVAFKGCDKNNCKVYVPKGTYDYYIKYSDFRYFKNIEEFDATGINNVITPFHAKEVSRYSINGQRLSAPTKGLNIVKYSDGSVKKVAIQ
nr:leucine-rich repeat domain-containing protein [uncultured Prevotella sp.]